MLGRALAFVLIFWASAPAANAQPPSGGGDFCATAPADLLAALDGSWTLQQGLTMMTIPAMNNMTMPLPPQPPVGVRFGYDGEQRVVNVIAADLSDGIVMFPTAPEQAPAAAAMIAPASANTSGGCDWYALPTLIGTNVYTELDITHVRYARSKAACDRMVVDAITNDDGEGIGHLFYRGFYKDLTDVLCGDAATSRAGCIQMLRAATTNDDGEGIVQLLPPEPVQALVDGLCGDNRPQGRFELEMTLVLRFSSANHGSGMLYFDGRQDGHQVRAVAPVTLRR